MIWHDLPIAILDTETTGVDDNARIVEVAAVVLHRDAIVSRWSRRVSPGIPIPAEASAVHGITDDDVADLPSIADVWEELRRVTAGFHAAAYNAPFDRRLLSGEIARHGLDPLVLAHDIWLDPLVWAREIDKFERGKRLTDVAARRGISTREAHGAFGDALMTARVMWAMRKDERIPAELSDLLAWQEECRKRQENEFAEWRAKNGGKQC